MVLVDLAVVQKEQDTGRDLRDHEEQQEGARRDAHQAGIRRLQPIFAFLRYERKEGKWK